VVSLVGALSALVLGGFLLSAPDATVVLRLGDQRITESSGLAASSVYDGVLYTHNDSGDEPRLFAVGPGVGTRATLRLPEASAVDWEDLAAGPGNSLWVADIGDNRSVRAEVVVYRVTEPAQLVDTDLPSTAYRLRYPDGPHDAEGLLVHPRTGRVMVVTKELLGGGVYAAPARLPEEGTAVLRRVADAPPRVTGAAYAPDGASFVLRNYRSATVWAAPGEQLGRVVLPAQRQGESVTYAPDGRALLVGSEGTAAPIWRVPLPARLRPAVLQPTALPSPTPRPTASPVAAAGSGAGPPLVAPAVALALLAGAGGITWWAVARRRGRYSR
jgi:hypothetical protein